MIKKLAAIFFLSVCAIFARITCAEAKLPELCSRDRVAEFLALASKESDAAHWKGEEGKNLHFAKVLRLFNSKQYPIPPADIATDLLYENKPHRWAREYCRWFCANSDGTLNEEFLVRFKSIALLMLSRRLRLVQLDFSCESKLTNSKFASALDQYIGTVNREGEFVHKRKNGAIVR